MNIYNGSGLTIAVVFAMMTQIGLLGTKAQDLVIYFHLGEGENISQFQIRALQAQSENVLLKYETGQINNPTGK